jgi:hypothetical protein
MGPSELLHYLVRVLEEIGIPYLVTGSTATIAYGEPRFTNDIDVVVDLHLDQVPALCAAFADPEYYLSRSAAETAVRRRHQFNIIHPSSGLKIDVVVASDSPFDRNRFARRRRLPGGEDFEVTFGSPEDVIIKKMEYYREGGSDKHLRDITGVLKVQGDRLDRQYVAQWATRLGLQEIWEMILQKADSSQPESRRTDAPL